MPTIAQQRVSALDELKRNVQPDVEPALDEATDLEPLLDAVQRASIWAVSTAYVYGDVVMPTTRNGHRYKCIVAGTSGTTEPTWLKSTAAQQTDGTSSPALTWQEDGPDYSNVFDVRLASHNAWVMKAGKVSELTDYWIGQQRVSEDQLFTHCMKMADRFAPLLVG